jgi:simple sugar transport system ATP-binding protein
MDYPEVKKHSRKLIEEFDVRTPNEEVTAASLSGGNQQKLIVAREISKEPDLLIVCQPTRGLDVGAIEYIHKRIIQERDNGKAVLLVSLELDEILSLSDRIAVMYDGHIVDVLDREDATEQKLGVLMAGGSLKDNKKEVETLE